MFFLIAQSDERAILICRLWWKNNLQYIILKNIIASLSIWTNVIITLNTQLLYLIVNYTIFLVTYFPKYNLNKIGRICLLILLCWFYSSTWFIILLLHPQQYISHIKRTWLSSQNIPVTHGIEPVQSPCSFLKWTRIPLVIIRRSYYEKELGFLSVLQVSRLSDGIWWRQIARRQNGIHCHVPYRMRCFWIFSEVKSKIKWLY